MCGRYRLSRRLSFSVVRGIQFRAGGKFNKKQFKSKLPIRLLAVGGQYSIPNMGDLLRPYFQDVKSVVISDSGHFVPEEQPEALVKALLAFI